MLCFLLPQVPSGQIYRNASRNVATPLTQTLPLVLAQARRPPFDHRYTLMHLQALLLIFVLVAFPLSYRLLPERCCT
mgnify:CR=1 FL=1